MINFDSVESASAVNKTEFKSVKGGIQNLTVEAVEGVVAASGNPGVEVTFKSTEADASFNHRFWLSVGAVPRVQYLVEKFTGSKLTGSIAPEEVADKLAALLVGKTKQVIVDVELRTNEKNGKVYTNEYPTLRFAGFVEPQGKDAEVRVTDNTAKTTATVELPTVDADDNELPF